MALEFQKLYTGNHSAYSNSLIETVTLANSFVLNTKGAWIHRLGLYSAGVGFAGRSMIRIGNTAGAGTEYLSIFGSAYAWFDCPLFLVAGAGIEAVNQTATVYAAYYDIQFL